MTSHMATKQARLIALRAQQADLIASLRAKRVATCQGIVCGSAGRPTATGAPTAGRLRRRGNANGGKRREPVMMNDFIEIQGQGRMILVPRIHRQRVHNFAPFLEGSRRWLANGDFQFEATVHNCRKALDAGFMVIMKDAEFMVIMKSPLDESELKRPEFKSPLADLEHQTQAADKIQPSKQMRLFCRNGHG